MHLQHVIKAAGENRPPSPLLLEFAAHLGHCFVEFFSHRQMKYVTLIEIRPTHRLGCECLEELWHLP